MTVAHASDEALERKAQLDQRVNRFAAILMPLLEAGAMGFTTYVMVYSICIRYLIKPPAGYQMDARKATAIGLMVVYFVLLAFLALTFLRLLQVIWMHPGLVPLGHRSSEKQTSSTKQFDRLDAYVCDYQGSPLWCEKCHNWKPDRAHHSSQLGRCVRRMDHFCPYAGGIISETSHKFFVQFLFYGSLYTGFCLIVFAAFLGERSKRHGSRPATWIAGVALTAFFFLFAFSMFMTTFYNMALNYTTVEMIQRGSATNIALLGSSPPHSTTISSQIQANVLCEIQRTDSRPYIVLQTLPGENPWDDGVWNNVRSVMGMRLVDWLNPLKMGPCTNHIDCTGEFPWGEAVLRMMDDYSAGSEYRRSRRLSRKSGPQNKPRHS